MSNSSVRRTEVTGILAVSLLDAGDSFTFWRLDQKMILSSSHFPAVATVWLRLCTTPVARQDPSRFAHWMIWAAMTNRILRGGLLWPMYAQRRRDTGWSSVVGASWASSPPTGRVGLRFTAVLNGPWESSVMDSVKPQHTLALCVWGSWTFSHTHAHTHFWWHKCLFCSPLLVTSLQQTEPPRTDVITGAP